MKFVYFKCCSDLFFFVYNRPVHVPDVISSLSAERHHSFISPLDSTVDKDISASPLQTTLCLISEYEEWWPHHQNQTHTHELFKKSTPPQQMRVLTCSQWGATGVDVHPVLLKVWSALLLWIHSHRGGSEHRTRTWGAEERRRRGEEGLGEDKKGRVCK